MTDIRQLPAQQERVETGPVQFGDDWPGVFIRGDNAGWYAFNLGQLLESDLPIDFLMASNLRNLQQDLGGCVLGPCLEMVMPVAPDPVDAARNAIQQLTPEQRRRVVNEFFVLCGVLQARPEFDLTPVLATDRVEGTKNAIRQLTDEQRAELSAVYCSHCGRLEPINPEEPYLRCQCWNDK